MKFSVPKVSLLEALNVTGKCIGGGIILPALGCYKFNISNDRLDITGGNMEVFITQSIEITGGDFETMLLVPATRILGWVKELPNVPIEFAIEERMEETLTIRSIRISAGNSKCLIPCESGEDYPMSPMANDLLIEVESASLILGIDKTLFACGKDELRPSLTGVNISVSEMQITFNGSDSHILATKTVDTNQAANHEIDLVVPANTMSIVKSTPCDDTVGIKVSKNAVVFQLNESTVLRSSLIAAKYLDIKSFIPESGSIASFEVSTLIGAVKRTIHFTGPGYPVLVLNFSDGELKIQVANDASEAATETVPVDYVGSPVRIGLNGINLLKCLNKIDGYTAKLNLNGPRNPVMLYEDDINPEGKKNLMMIMPLFLN